MGCETERLTAEHLAQTPERADHLIGDHVDVVLDAYRHDFREIGAWRHDHAAGSHDWLGDERGNRVRPFLDDQFLEFGGEPRRELFLALTVLGEAIVMRA